MDLDELKRLREENFSAHKKKKREYYLKNKLAKQLSNENKTPRKVYDYEKELSGEDFNLKIKSIIKQQKEHVDSRKDKIIAKIQEYKEKKKEYYLENKEKRLQYDKDYREEKKEDLKEYRRRYYQENKEKILAKQKEKRKTNKT